VQKRQLKNPILTQPKFFPQNLDITRAENQLCLGYFFPHNKNSELLDINVTLTLT